MESLDIEKIDYNTNELECVFDGLFPEGLVIKTDFDYKKEQTEYKDEGLGFSDYYVAEKITFFDFKIFHEDNPVNISELELTKLKQKIENKLSELLEIYINEN